MHIRDKILKKCFSKGGRDVKPVSTNREQSKQKMLIGTITCKYEVKYLKGK